MSAAWIFMLQLLTLVYILCQYGQRCYLWFILCSKGILISILYIQICSPLSFSNRKFKFPFLILGSSKTENSPENLQYWSITVEYVRCLELKWHCQLLENPLTVDTSIFFHGCCRSYSLTASKTNSQRT